MTKKLEQKINECIKSNCLKKTITKMLEKNKDVVMNCFVFRVRGTKRVKLIYQNGLLSDNLEILNRYNSGEFVLMDIYIMENIKPQKQNSIEMPVSSRACPVYGCLDCELPECDEECPPGTCQ